MKTTMRYHCMPIRMAMIQKINKQKRKITSVGKALEKLDFPCIAVNNAGMNIRVQVSESLLSVFLGI